MTSTDSMTPPTDLEVECPRCGAAVIERFYGPCDTCRADLRQKITGEQSDVTAAEYEPKMNVTPNAVASKE